MIPVTDGIWQCALQRNWRRAAWWWSAALPEALIRLLTKARCRAAVKRWRCWATASNPPENRDLAERILKSGGAIISEFAPDSEPLPFHFPIRNRLIAGLSDALLLIEARHRSGTASTVNHALAQGKEVFALPGNVGAPGSELPLQLLKEGANLCTEADDIIGHMGWRRTEKQLTLFEEPEKKELNPILHALMLEEKTFEELLEETGMTPGDLGAELTLLEMEGKVHRVGGRAYQKA